MLAPLETAVIKELGASWVSRRQFDLSLGRGDFGYRIFMRYMDIGPFSAVYTLFSHAKPRDVHESPDVLIPYHIYAAEQLLVGVQVDDNLLAEPAYFFEMVEYPTHPLLRRREQFQAVAIVGNDTESELIADLDIERLERIVTRQQNPRSRLLSLTLFLDTSSKR